MTGRPVVDFKQVLKEAGLPVSEEAIRAEFNQIVKSEGLITNVSKMSPFWRLVSTIVTRPVMWMTDLLAETVLANIFVATASGKFLRLLAWAVNITAKPATNTVGLVRFYKLEANTAVTIKAGTLIQTERLNGVIYALSVVEDTVIPEGIADSPVRCRAVEAGGAYNLAPGYYRILPIAVAGISHAANGEDWLVSPGADDEADDDLRERCRNQFNLVGNYHTDAIYRSMIAGIAGLSIDRVFFLHDAPRGPGTANAYLLLDSGIASQPFIDSVNHYITQQGHHGHGDDLQCFPMPETHHELTATCYIKNAGNFTQDEKTALLAGVSTLVRCAFRENSTYPIKKTRPYSRFSFSNLASEVHDNFSAVESIVFSLPDVVSDLSVPRLSSLTVVIGS